MGPTRRGHLFPFLLSLAHLSTLRRRPSPRARLSRRRHSASLASTLPPRALVPTPRHGLATTRACPVGHDATPCTHPLASRVDARHASWPKRQNLACHGLANPRASPIKPQSAANPSLGTFPFRCHHRGTEEGEGVREEREGEEEERRCARSRGRRREAAGAREAAAAAAEASSCRH